MWLRLGVVSILLGTLLAMLQLAFYSYPELSDYELPSLLLRFLIFIAVCFFVLGLFVLFFTLLRRFFHWLFSWRIIKRCLIAFAYLAALIVLFYAEEDWRGKRAWENYKREWEAKGEKFDFASFIPPPVPDDQNFALTPIVASCYSRVLDKKGHHIQPENTNVINRLEMQIYSNCKDWPTNHIARINSWQWGAKEDLVGWQEYFRSPANINYYCPDATNEFPTTAQPQSPADDVLFALSKFDSAIEKLRQASRLPYSRFPLNYDEQLPQGILLPHLAALKSCAQVLQLRAIAELENRQTPKAFDDVKLILYLANSIHEEQCLISQFTRMLILDFALQPIWEGLVERKWSDDQLAEINRELAGLDFLSDYDAMVRGERAMAIKLIDHERRNHNADLIPFLYGGDSYDFEIRMNLFFYHSFPSGWYYQNDIAIARAFQESLRTDNEMKQRILSHDIAWRIDYAGNIVQSHYRSPYYFFVRMLFPELGRAAKKFAFTQASVDMARTTCALERYHLAHGEYPETLDTLVPQFIEKLPHDIINGQPLHYRRTSDGQFVLYSIGWNETDDGGVPGTLSDPKHGDWVWQYPAK